MASVDVLTAARVAALVNSCVATASIDSSGFLTLTLADGVTVVDVGYVTTAAGLAAVTNTLVKSAAINTVSGVPHLVLTLGDGTTTVDVGAIMTPTYAATITDLLFKSGTINSSGHLIMTKNNNATQDVGLVKPDRAPSTPTGSLAAGVNVTITSFTPLLSNKTLAFKAVLVWNGATTVASSTGNISHKLVATLPSNLAPVVTQYVFWDHGGLNGGGATIDTDGTITLTSMMPSATLAAGDIVNIGCSYVIP